MMDLSNPFKLFHDSQKQLEDITREKHNILSEIIRLQRKKHQLLELQTLPYQGTLQGVTKIDITTAISYDQQPPINYFTDRYINPLIQHQKVQQIDELAQDDQIHSVNAFFPSHFTNLAGLGGVLGTQFGTGGRIPPIERHSCYVDELKQKIKPTNKKETDTDYDRVSSLLLSANMELDLPFIVSQSKKILPLGRVLAESASQNFIIQSQFLPNSEQIGNYIQFSQVNQLIKQQNTPILDQLAKQIIKNKDSVKKFCQENKCIALTDKQKLFERDKHAIRTMKNQFAHDFDFTKSEGWKCQEIYFQQYQDKLIKSVIQIGSIDFDIPLAAAKPQDKISWEIYKLNFNFNK
ncbi:hypothetical protein SS50377_21148 [Spironucleus salmonicida]|uniref:Uncharacterized protein n=1 Tax=Spironucleus salmonicida TaxID=348837 RepID=V6LH90_9EUKA|nr:hypothetical protein SS50377_21148 [Spironucleus salmonicida]|eukprot:EST43930.1 hypothetical protein SS50377_16232 [Spironucleus salmonicida]